MGGISRERDVSIASGNHVADALKQAGVNVVVADIKPDCLDILDDRSIDVFFIALHGRFGEDGVLQEILESKGLIYTGSSPQASRLAFDKWESKNRFQAAGIATPEAILFEPDAKNIDLENRIRHLGQKYVVKPLREGSTIGVSIVDNPQAAITAAENCSTEFGDCMIESYIKGREITVGVLGTEALPVLEIRPRSGFYDYHAKYIDDKTEYLFDTIRDRALVTRIQKSAIDCFKTLGCRGVARVDFILGDDGRPYVLEINTVPGLTCHSLLPKAAAKAGLSMSKLCLKIVDLAMADAPKTDKTAARRQ
jgi:D-alanine-D-alanine ligase